MHEKELSLGKEFFKGKNLGVKEEGEGMGRDFGFGNDSNSFFSEG